MPVAVALAGAAWVLGQTVTAALPLYALMIEDLALILVAAVCGVLLVQPFIKT